MYDHSVVIVNFSIFGNLFVQCIVIDSFIEIRNCYGWVSCWSLLPNSLCFFTLLLLTVYYYSFIHLIIFWKKTESFYVEGNSLKETSRCVEKISNFSPCFPHLNCEKGKTDLNFNWVRYTKSFVCIVKKRNKLLLHC